MESAVTVQSLLHPRSSHSVSPTSAGLSGEVLFLQSVRGVPGVLAPQASPLGEDGVRALDANEIVSA